MKNVDMTRVRIKRVYAPEEAADGFRVLVDRMWPRGMRRDELHFDLWAKQLTPSTALRQWYHADPESRWTEFKRRYTQELHASPEVCSFVESIREKPVVTLLFASKNATENHALILQDYLQQTLAAKSDSDPLTIC